jgi:hypothetical protein
MTKNLILFAAFIFLSKLIVAQGTKTISGYVIDQRSKMPVPGATAQLLVGNKNRTTDPKGFFTINNASSTDTLVISHIGYETLYLPIANFTNGVKISIAEIGVQLKTVTITSRSLNLKEIDNGMRLMRDNLYAYERETTNALYNLFLSSLEETQSDDLLKRCNYNLSEYDNDQRLFYAKYSEPIKGPRNKKDTTQTDFSQFPAVNISHEGAELFCAWLTQQYNTSTGKKKFKKVKFRLPSMKEWQIAALGHPKFQSWNLDENYVEVFIPSDTVSAMMPKGKKSPIPVGGNNVWYPWFNAYNYRKKPFNHLNCCLGNFRIDGQKQVCNNVIRPGNDGWTKMSQTASYFPNDMGLYDVVGNVAEMIDENFKACGGSWNDTPENATIRSVKNFRKPNDTVGFRIFMEVLER